MKSFCHNMRKVEKGGGDGEMCNDGKCSKHTGKACQAKRKRERLWALLINEEGKANLFPHRSEGFNDTKYNEQQKLFGNTYLNRVHKKIIRVFFWGGVKLSNLALSKRANDMPPPPSPSPPPKEEEEYERALSYEERGNLSSSPFSCTDLLRILFLSLYFLAT